jgi:hypothetical protein
MAREPSVLGWACGEQEGKAMESSKGPKEGRDTAGATGIDDAIKSARVQENLETQTN